MEKNKLQEPMYPESTIKVKLQNMLEEAQEINKLCHQLGLDSKVPILFDVDSKEYQWVLNQIKNCLIWK